MWKSTNLPSTSASSASPPFVSAIGTFGSEPQRIVAIDPYKIGVVGAARVSDALELRSRELIQRPAFRTEFSGRRRRAIQRPLHLRAVEARKMPARERGPDDAIEIEVDAARSVTLIGRQIDFRECGFRGFGPGTSRTMYPG